MMPNLNSIIRTARAIEGAGNVARRIPCGISGWLWLAGSARLDTLAVEAMLADGSLAGTRDEYRLSERGRALRLAIAMPPSPAATSHATA
ncbi:hypothetical protein FHR90_003070 [Endobacter medicaginis]|uniref:Uncharacterized protein n=1 Tax=Endobacter medicaginis TaxID=1181271 RepID=A0A850NSH6_9PROT|nr:hypothetical protein [Endobacter medicaginis]MBB3175216.1 hypothetical protein [Endobacter medicaginis]MCX5476260.1 hypothetical protein [Endobacter medicaginis]NVN28977.1 hypothetical protein [Endobacter medicaginis]